jgi:CheY-like chemotaxis protein
VTSATATELGEESEPPYDRPPLSKQLWFGKSTKDELPIHPESFYREHGIDLVLRREAVEIALQSPPDLIIMDITMPEMNGLEAAAKIAESQPDIPVIMFSLHLSEDVVGRFKTGAIRGAVAKSEAARDLLTAVRSVLAGGTFFSSKTAF